MGTYTINEVKTSKQKKEFIAMAHPIYEGCDSYVAPLEGDINSVFDRTKNKMYDGGDAVRFLAIDNKSGKCVGRIAAFYNEKLSSGNGDLKVGGCGFYESIDSQEVANLLFDTAKSWLEERGFTAMDGPINFGDREMWWGLLTDGYKEPIYGMNYHHPYYKPLFENYGFKNYFEGYTFYRTTKNATVNPMLMKKAERLKETGLYRFEHIDKKNLDVVAAQFCEIYSKAWENFGDSVAKVTIEDAQKLISKLKPIIDEKLIYFAYYEDKAIGFFISIPDINSVIKPLKGKTDLWSTLRLIYRLKIKKVAKSAIGLVFGVMPEFQGRGIEAGMINALRETVLRGEIDYDYLTLAWVGDFNPLMIRMVEKYVEAERDRTYTTYRYIFDREYPFERAPKVSISRNR